MELGAARWVAPIGDARDGAKPAHGAAVRPRCSPTGGCRLLFGALFTARRFNACRKGSANTAASAFGWHAPPRRGRALPDDQRLTDPVGAGLRPDWRHRTRRSRRDDNARQSIRGHSRSSRITSRRAGRQDGASATDHCNGFWHGRPGLEQAA
jgi:hypothetical protein